MLRRMRHIKRRDFLKMLGAATAGVALKDLDVLWAVPDEFVEEALRGPGIETFKKEVEGSNKVFISQAFDTYFSRQRRMR